MTASPIRLACLDLAGTTIGDIAMVERAFSEAIATQGIVPPASEEAYAEATGGYRAPPPIPVQKETTPVLPEAALFGARDLLPLLSAAIGVAEIAADCHEEVVA